MMFHKNNFEEFFTKDQAALIAKICNQLLDQNAIVMYGNVYQSGKSDNFTTEKKRTDTHVCLAVGIEEMGRLAPSEDNISIERPTSQDILRAKADLVDQLTKENQLLRSKS
jgi:hypothetical protein